MVKQFLIAAGALLLLGSCTEDGDTIYREVDAPTLTLEAMRSDLIEITPDGTDVTFSWPMPAEGLSLAVEVVKDGKVVAGETYPREVTSFVQHNVEANIPYSYIFRITDGEAFSDGVIKTYTRAGATTPTELAASQREGESGYEAVVTWAPLTDAKELTLVIAKGGSEETVTLEGTATEHVVKSVAEGDELNLGVHRYVHHELQRREEICSDRECERRPPQRRCLRHDVLRGRLRRQALLVRPLRLSSVG